MKSKICISFIIIYTLALIILSILGNKTRKGYLSEFKFDEIHINQTLELNNLDIEETKKLFTIDNQLDNNALINYIFTNEAITNYNYGFKLKYYSKIFRHSDIYGVYIDTNKVLQDNSFIKEINMDKNGSPFGNLISTNKINDENIYNVTYYLRIKKVLISLILFITFIYLYVNFSKIISKLEKRNSKIYHLYLKYDNFMTVKRSIILFILIGIILFLLHLWIGFPGYFYSPDNINILTQSVQKNYSNWHPVTIAVTLNFLYKLFGQHTFYLTLINLICLYSGLILIAVSLYLKTKNRNIMFIYFISFIPNFYFTVITQLKDVTASMYLWLAICIIFFMILIPIKRLILKIFIYLFVFILIIFSLLWRHNMIVSIYPIILFLIFLAVYKLNIENKIKNIFIYLSISLLAALVLILILKITPHIFIKNQINLNLNTPNHIFLIQIASCAVPNNDDSLIPTNWYEKEKNFEDLKEMYSVNKYDADAYSVSWRKERIFKPVYLEDISKIWMSYIMKYPYSYFKFLSLHLSKWLSLNIDDYIITVVPYDIPKVLEDNGFKTYYVPFNNLRYKVSHFLDSGVRVPIILLFMISIIIFLLSIFILIKHKLKNYILLSFSFFLSFSSLATFFIVVAFSPVFDSRYMYPMLPLSIMSIISFVYIIYDFGGFKKIIKELRGNSK
ncbi:hypothetical protein [uncultured Brachyspira sp.]|uniref:hypothetical protein n=1 Tax=uncultured Brachyspira sp. TaxID=221953 RepID=UPI0026272AD6|nr:hypothetical protein [uncultured Brachyspira sp.]